MTCLNLLSLFSLAVLLFLSSYIEFTSAQKKIPCDKLPGGCPEYQYCNTTTGKCMPCNGNCCPTNPCPYDKVCKDGKCVEKPCKPGGCPKNEYCDTTTWKCTPYYGTCCPTNPCPYGLVCNKDGKCIKEPCKPGGCPKNEYCDTTTWKCTPYYGTCSLKNPCPYGLVCNKDGKCVKEVCDKPCPPGQECVLILIQCLAGSGPCEPIKRCVPITCPPPPNGCPDGLVCVNGKCASCAKLPYACKKNEYCNKFTGKCTPFYGTCCSTKPCPYGFTCENGKCMKLPCDKVCPKGQECYLNQVQCIRAPCPPVQVCQPVRCPSIPCPDGKVCDNGKCVPCDKLPYACEKYEYCDKSTGKCTPSFGSCVSKPCPYGFYCKDGNCVKDTPCDKWCPEGQECYLNPVECFAPPCPPLKKCRPIKCPSIDCPNGQICDNGKCVPDAECAKVTCVKGTICYNGCCYKDIPCGGACGGKKCYVSDCYANSLCPQLLCKEDKCPLIRCRGGYKCVNSQCVPEDDCL